MSPFIALDIETTGLDPKKNTIIEIAAIKFDGKRIIDTWEHLIDPKQPIPPEITLLTGITDEMVLGQPMLEDLAQDLTEFIGNSPILGHFVRFDLSFLNRAGIGQYNQVIDTFEMAAVLLPSASRYSLAALGYILGLPHGNLHRALEDTRLTHNVYIKLYEKSLDLPVPLLAEIVRLGKNTSWEGTWIFDQILNARSQVGISEAPLQLDQFPAFQISAQDGHDPLVPSKEISPIDEDEIAAHLEHGGTFSKYFPSFESRPQQQEMLRSICKALNESQHLMAEAGTGTGKSLAYLLPAACWAITNSTRVVISTNTINLQDQLISKDIPDLKTALGLDLRAVLLKGRSNYLCPRKLDLMRHNGADSAESMRLLAKTLVWLIEGGSGDRSELNIGGPIEREIWTTKLSSADEGCKTETCVGRMGGVCPFYRARQAAQSAHLIIVNHALLLADAVTGSRILPDFEYLIIDEAHHLEAATTDALTFRITEHDIERLLKELGGTSSGVLGSILRMSRNFLSSSDQAIATGLSQKSTDSAFQTEQHFHAFFRSLDEFLKSVNGDNQIGKYGIQLRILPSTRTLPDWTNVEITWSTLDETLSKLGGELNNLVKSFGEAGENVSEEFSDAVSYLNSIKTRLSEIQTSLTAWVSEPDTRQIYWAEARPPSMNIAIQIAPLHIGPLMEEYLWHEKSSVILTSATLTTNNEFAYIKDRLSADEADELIVGSPFDYQHAALLYIANDIPEPNGEGFQYMLNQTITKLAKVTHGRMLVLFTSYDQLRRTSRAISPFLSNAGISVFEQGEGASSSSLLESFRETEKAVLLGTRSFWEGVDIVGEALSALVIVKLPFDVPTEPVIAARAETFEDPFGQFHIPEAILRFRQGFGRLIRTQSDRGIVVVLDKRIVSKQYGQMFLNSLPPCTKKAGPIAGLPADAERWLNI